MIQHPNSFQPQIDAMRAYTAFHFQEKELDALNFAILFVTKKAEIDEWAPRIAAKMQGDALLWFCYPKGSSKNYSCDFNRDNGWNTLGELGWEPVRMVAIDKDWSALRFRKVAFIKKITRWATMALTKEAKQRTSGRREE
ncbi:MAG: hypothetical protein AAF990_23075 [Bacteroidota bacterium]